VPPFSALTSRIGHWLRSLAPSLPPSVDMAAAAVYQVGQQTSRRYLGSCCCYREPRLFLTAHHCIADIPPEELRIAASPYSEVDGDAIVQRVIRHPDADLAALISGAGLREISPLSPVESLIAGGEEVDAHGFPLEAEDGNLVPTPKHFRGVIQRLFDYSGGGYSYEALELSFGAPAGLSGGAVALPFRDRGLVLHDLVGIITNDRESARTLRTVTDIVAGNLRFQERVEGVALHAIAVDLTALEDWLADLRP
jgi:hypothetical protein